MTVPLRLRVESSAVGEEARQRGLDPPEPAFGLREGMRRRGPARKVEHQLDLRPHGAELVPFHQEVLVTVSGGRVTT